MAETLVSISNLSKVFYTDEIETHALANVDLSIQASEYIAIRGPSGCGKSTLLSILGLMEMPTSGHYEIMGRDVSELNLANRARIRNRHIGFIFQNFNLIGDMHVLDNVALPLAYRKVALSVRRKQAAELLDRVGLSQRAKHFPSQLSGGQQQRVAVARAMIGSPDLLLADEPTGNLDSKNGDAIMQLLQEIRNEGTTVCLVTHDPRYFDSAVRTIEMLDGQVVQAKNA